MKKLLFTLTALTLLLCTTVGVGAAFLGGAAPVLAEDVTLIKTGLRGENIKFSDTDFKEALAVPDFSSVTVESLPKSTEGTLLFAGRRVGVGQKIKRKNIAALSFVPATKNVTECKFSFTCDGLAGGAQILCTLKFIDKVNYAPKIDGAESAALSVSTQKNVSLFGTMSAADPEGDALEYIVVSYPTRGTLTVTDKTSGEYRYTPDATYTGEDSFRYVARDEYGNYSYPATVEIRIDRRASDVCYTDMTDRPEYGAALVMTAKGIMAGAPVGDDTLFSPDGTVTRAEFVAMALKNVGVRRDTTLSATCFDDDGEIPASLRGYVATAQRIGVVNGSFSGGKLLFRPNDPVTKYEAASILAALTGAKADGDTAAFADADTVPAWARPGVLAMISGGIFRTTDGKIGADAKVTRAETAVWLCRIADKM